MIPYRVHPDAEQEYWELLAWFADFDLRIMDRFQEEFEVILRRIRQFPELYRIRRYNVRRVNFQHFREYYVAYMICKDMIVIIAVAHAKRRPFYWRSRPKQSRDMF